MRFSISSWVAVPRRGASCYSNEWERLERAEKLLSPAGARVVTTDDEVMDFVFALLSPAGARVVTMLDWVIYDISDLLSPAGARSVTQSNPQQAQCSTVAVPRRGASCYVVDQINEEVGKRLLSPAGARVVTR